MIEQPDLTMDMEQPSERPDLDSLLAPKWYALYTRSRFEKKMLSELTDRRIEVFLPMREILSRWKDRKKEIAWPLFPGYCFARFDARDSLRVVTCNGVVVRCDTHTPHQEYELACAFTDIKKEDKLLIEEYIGWRLMQDLVDERLSQP